MITSKFNYLLASKFEMENDKNLAKESLELYRIELFNLDHIIKTNNEFNSNNLIKIFKLAEISFKKENASGSFNIMKIFKILEHSRFGELSVIFL